jgi:2-polyprenyl-3-methyl-5-hydroxy-6-metoxy-1,4-benzoquinol methylase
MVDQSQFTGADPYGRTPQLDEETLAAIATRLEGRARHPFFIDSIAEYLNALALSGTESVLDLGCGTGIVARALAKRLGSKGSITAIDISPNLVDVGRQLAREEGVAERIDFSTGDAHQLGLLSESFDVVVMHTLVIHVVDPATVLAEARRLLRPGGRLVVFDGDFSSFSYLTDEADGGAETIRNLVSTMLVHPTVMRLMPRLLVDGGFRLEWSRAEVAADIGRVDFWASHLPSLRITLPKTGYMSETQAHAFVDSLERASAENRFFGACNYYSYIARRAVSE